MIRLACAADVDGVERIYEEIMTDADCLRFTNWQRGKYPCRATAERALEKGWLYVMEEEGEIVAAAILNGEQLPEYDKLPWAFEASREQVFVIHTLCVPPSRAGRGYARAFVAFSEELGRSLGCTALRLDTYEGNEPALIMYPKLGYRTVGKTLFHFQNIIWENLVCFEKEL